MKKNKCTCNNKDSERMREIIAKELIEMIEIMRKARVEARRKYPSLFNNTKVN